ncbi:MAG: alcohol dehydrogenase catalytic domain-containing protein [Anaerolineales bacterium]|nr:alcohol dehydrogenase catalytic domain-containing protein [Anaerolineales bacterium]
MSATNTMCVMWCERPQEVELRHLPIPTVGDDDVLVKVAYAAICPWDVRAFSGLSSAVAFPRVLGHEVAGRVAAVGKNVKELEIGQAVAPDMIVKCGVCKACRTGRPNRCWRPTYLQYGGGYADYVCVPQRNIHPIRPGVSLKAAAMMEPLACVLRGQDMLRLYPGEVELVVGLGPIGLMHLQVARAFGARVLASDPVSMRREQAQALGATWVVDPQQTNLTTFVQDATAGWGVDAIALTVGSARMVEECVKLLAPGGRLNIFAGIYPKDQVSLDPNQIHYGEWIITGSSDSTPENMHRALGLIEAGQVQTEALISHLLPLEELAAGLELVKQRVGLKIVMEVNGEQ